MDTQKIVEDYFGFLTEAWGFKKWRVVKTNLSLNIQYRTEDFGVDIQIEYIGFLFSVLLVRLENGVEPNGYYVQNGKIVRKYLEEFLLESGLIKKSEIDEYKKFRKKIRKSNLTDSKRNDMEVEIIKAKSILLERNMKFILDNKDRLFDK